MHKRKKNCTFIEYTRLHKQSFIPIVTLEDIASEDEEGIGVISWTPPLEVGGGLFKIKITTVPPSKTDLNPSIPFNTALMGVDSLSFEFTIIPKQWGMPTTAPELALQQYRSTIAYHQSGDPLSTDHLAMRFQSHYSPPELLASGLMPGDIINGIGLHIQSAPLCTLLDFTVSVGFLPARIASSSPSTLIHTMPFYGPINLEPLDLGAEGWKWFPFKAITQPSNMPSTTSIRGMTWDGMRCVRFSCVLFE